ncbi:hypothetical protein P22_0965 [Propionispora sp. 2/2-37]|uniref:hypothetical protein n=1 Tax=Propionispora sp. 2/2-37 TaxID=1677858 RepID=UPI0006BB7534|nr:hypothetical protein [Propionispora sp. 2/2-37]CUH94896.1 hypothetical protein P22_0965 [Propionispora sp. 2/2-37]
MDGCETDLQAEYQLMRLKAACETLDILMGLLEQEAAKTQNTVAINQIATTIIALLELDIQSKTSQTVVTNPVVSTYDYEE